METLRKTPEECMIGDGVPIVALNNRYPFNGSHSIVKFLPAPIIERTATGSEPTPLDWPVKEWTFEIKRWHPKFGDSIDAWCRTS